MDSKDRSKSRSATSKLKTFISAVDTRPYLALLTFLYSTYPIKEDFLRATESQGIPTVDDLQDLATGHGAEHWLKWINRDVSSAKMHTKKVSGSCLP